MSTQKLFLRMDNNKLVSRTEFVEYLEDCSKRWASKDGGMAIQVARKAERIRQGKE